MTAQESAVMMISIVLFLSKSFSSSMLENVSVITLNLDANASMELFDALMSIRFGEISTNNDNSLVSDCFVTSSLCLFAFVVLTGFSF